MAYACIGYDPAASTDAAAAIAAGSYEVVLSSNCGLVDVVTGFEPVKLSGKGTQRTKPFALPAGDYEIKLNWGKGCRYSKDLPDPGSMYLNNIDFPDQQTDFEQSTYAYGVEEGRYYMKVNTITGSKCSWSFLISPFAE